MTDKVTIADCRAAGFCIRQGVKPKCDALGLDFRQLVKDGLPLSEIKPINDSQVQRIVGIAEARILLEKDKVQ